MAPRATKLATTGAPVNISRAAPPTTGQVLTATGAETAVWAAGGSVTATALTNNTTGVAGNTLAAGAGITTFFFTHTFIGGTSAIDVLTNFTPGFKFKILSVVAATSVLLVGASGSRVFNLEIDTTDVTGGVVTVPIANAAVGVVTAGTAITALNTGTAAQTISIELQNGGTAFTAGMITFAITVQNMDTADAIASLAAKINTIITDLTT